MKDDEGLYILRSTISQGRNMWGQMLTDTSLGISPVMSLYIPFPKVGLKMHKQAFLWKFDSEAEQKNW